MSSGKNASIDNLQATLAILLMDGHSSMLRRLVSRSAYYISLGGWSGPPLDFAIAKDRRIGLVLFSGQTHHTLPNSAQALSIESG